MPWVYKTSVSHLKVQNTCTPLKHTDGKRKFKRMLSFLLVENGRLFFTKSSFEKFEIHEIFITADRSAWAVLKRNQAAKFWKNFQVHFVLYRLACGLWMSANFIGFLLLSSVFGHFTQLMNFIWKYAGFSDYSRFVRCKFTTDRESLKYCFYFENSRSFKWAKSCKLR